MTELRNEIIIAAPDSIIFDLAASTERWPEYLPHYRFVRILKEEGASRLVEMGASRDGIPVRWTARQWNDAATPRIRFEHVAGWTRGMQVAWEFAPHPEGGTHVSIIHHLDFQFPVARKFLGRYVVGEFFVHNIAGKTLRCMKALAERA
ncbi:MAG: hypothetical protein NVS1B14_04350 [Vulcanimicrobiaceae bacterium]